VTSEGSDLPGTPGDSVSAAQADTAIGDWTGRRVLIMGGGGRFGNELTTYLDAIKAQALVVDELPRPRNFPVRQRYRRGRIDSMGEDQLAAFDPQVVIYLAADVEPSVSLPPREDGVWRDMRVAERLSRLVGEFRSVVTVVLVHRLTSEVGVRTDEALLRIAAFKRFARSVRGPCSFLHRALLECCSEGDAPRASRGATAQTHGSISCARELLEAVAVGERTYELGEPAARVTPLEESVPGSSQPPSPGATPAMQPRQACGSEPKEASWHVEEPSREPPATLAVLVTSIGSKVPLLRRVRDALDDVGGGRLLGTDLDPRCIGGHFVDGLVSMPALAALDIDSFVRTCRAAGVTAVIPTRDPELDFFAAHRVALEAVGLHLLVASPEVVAVCRDKLKFAQRLEALGLPAIPTALSLDAFVNNQRLVVKERFGAGSRGLLLDVDRDTALRHAASLSAPVYQPFLSGREYSVDLYVTRSGRPLGAVARTRDVVVNGEAQVTTTCIDVELEEMCIRLALELGLTGHACMQLLRLTDGSVRFIECNARFGGASTLSIAAGLETFRWFLLESLGDDLSHEIFVRSPTPLRQVRHATDRIERGTRL